MWGGPRSCAYHKSGGLFSLTTSLWTVRLIVINSKSSSTLKRFWVCCAFFILMKPQKPEWPSEKRKFASKTRKFPTETDASGTFLPVQNRPERFLKSAPVLSVREGNPEKIAHICFTGPYPHMERKWNGRAVAGKPPTPTQGNTSQWTSWILVVASVGANIVAYKSGKVFGHHSLSMTK